MEICYALGAMEEIFMVVFFYSPGYVRSDTNEIYCFLKCDEMKKRKSSFDETEEFLKGLSLLIKIVRNSDSSVVENLMSLKIHKEAYTERFNGIH